MRAVDVSFRQQKNEFRGKNVHLFMKPLEGNKRHTG